jgi:anaerobic dimethyl sulfoxide reductase subunit A
MIHGKAGGYPFDVKFAWFIANNLVTQRGNTNKADQALKGLEFIVVHELFMTPTARYADLLLPASSAIERNDLTRPWPSGPYFTYINKAIDPVGESKSDFVMICELAERMGYQDFNPMTEEEWLKTFVTKNPETGPIIKDYDKFKREGVHRVKLEKPIVAFRQEIEDPEHHPFPTPSGKIEIFSQRVADIGNPLLPPIPKYLSTWEDRFDPLTEKYPLQLLSPHPRNRVHSELYLVDWLRETEPHAMWINPADAGPRGIEDGDEVLVYNGRGKLAIEARVTERIVPGVVSIPEGAWYAPDEQGIDRGGCVNVLTNDAYSPGGAAALKTALVQVGKA